MGDDTGDIATFRQPPREQEAAPVAVSRQFDDEWRRWIAENLMLEMSEESILQTLAASGFSPVEGAAEVARALQSPYFRGADRLRNRLRKRNWLLAAYRKLDRLRPRSQEIAPTRALARRVPRRVLRD